MSRSFRDAVCAAFGCAPEEYPEKVFRLCLHEHARPLAHLLRKVNPEIFRPDFELIEQVSAAKSLPELCHEVNQHRYLEANSTGCLRRALRLRLSGARLVRLGSKLLA